MRMRAQLLALFLALAATACGGSGSSAGSDTAPTAGTADAGPVLPGNSEIISLLYDPDYSVPSGFYVDERANTGRSFTMHHVLDDSGSFELCTDNFSEALEWEAADNASRAVQGYFVEAVETERYFEVARELSYDSDIGNIDDITSPGFARIFKCGHTSRDGVDRNLLSGYAGRLNVRPVDAASVRVFAEYLWQFAFFPNARRKVIGSVGSQSGDATQHTLQLVFASSQGIGECDRIEVAEWRFSANRTTGEVQRRFETVRVFEAELQSGIPVICN